MQQIYSSGYSELINNLPEDWKKPCKINNYRCPSRIVNLINKINKTYNSNNYIEQIAQKNQTGIVRVFILNKNLENKLSQEQIIREKMSLICQDLEWKDIKNVKTLVLEHAMAANRSGFGNFFLPLSQDSIIRDNLLQNSGINIPFLLEQFLPLINSIKNNNNFETMRILEKYSPLMNNEIISNNFKDLKRNIKDLNVNEDISIETLLSDINCKRLLEIPDDIKNGLNYDSKDNDYKEKDSLWNKALKASLKELMQYNLYIKGKLGFDTHQGVKGLEFNRVMAILDDEESNGFLFRYNKLLGTESLSDTDRKNIESGKDNVLSRTARLFYVICSRAEESLAIVVYSNKPSELKNNLIYSEFFSEDEIEIFN